MSTKQVRRLFTDFAPKQYNLTLDPDRNTLQLTGSVEIRGRKTGRPAARLVFHQQGLKITSARIIKVDKKGEQEISVTRINHHAKFEEVRLHAGQMLYPGEYIVHMTFTGQVTRPMDGIYPCYFTLAGQEKRLIATQFESHFARHAFPCIDEPEAKATFDLTLLSPLNETVLANTPIGTQTVLGDKQKTTFQTTPIMSTYLLAFAFGEMGYKEAKTKNGTTIRAYATPENVTHTDFALDCAVRALEYFETYFAIPFPLPKCDLIALPDFASGAMENWGLITFREQALLVDPDNTSLSTKQHVVEVVVHELAHQWFGNLVTMRWWNDLWLNEGFANVMAYMVADTLFPEWQMMTQYIVDEQQPGLKLDALENTHPIEVPVHHPDEIRTIFDLISYSKGGNAIMMLKDYLGETAFRDGLRHYLAKHAYGNTTTVDLWEALEIASKKPVKEIMTAWTTQPGYPLVSAGVQGKQVHLHQEQFFVNPFERAKQSTKRLWPVILHAGPKTPEVFESEEIDFTLPDSQTFKLNLGQIGFFRSSYDPKHLAELAKQVQAGKLQPVDRLGILSDAFETAKAGYSDTVSALKLLQAYSDEDHPFVWDIITSVLGSVRAIMNDEALREAMKPYCRQLVAKQLARLGWEPRKGESHFDLLLRPNILAIAALAEEKSVVDEALRRFWAMTKPEDIAPDLRGVIYTTAAREGDAKTFDRLLELQDSTTSAEERLNLAAALTDFKQPELIDRALGLITSEQVRLQDTIYWIAYSFSNRYARDASWQWMIKSWPWLKENIGNDLSFSRMPVYAARVMSDADFLPAYQKFFESVMEPSLERGYKQGCEMIEWQSDWKKRDLTAIKKFFKQLG